MSSSSTEVVETDRLPRHVAIVMDGNGRWAERRRLPRFAGHKAGAGTVEQVVEICGELGVQVLTLFAFSSENWRRPEEEVGMLLGLFMTTLDKQVKKLHANNVSLRIIGERSAFSEKLQMQIAKAEELTRDNNGMNLVVAANYGGRWDIVRAARQVAQRVEDGSLAVGDISPQDLESGIALHDLPEPDLFIRTGGEQRISNFLLWQLAYTELYFTDTLWPDFKRDELLKALESFAKRQRRYGKTGRQILMAEGG